ncbi:small integral membrane protein 26-like [Otolemur garnettii]|uniref:small integral membrane protein 26-like n=1 Tax=Otolemur garnettii TaxID=30611 RepID=UPI000C7ED8B2|nr:small integral membrane protein 26-like [Otolemur garnettii]
MHPGRATTWYRRMSVVYALGAWTLLGSVFILNKKKHKLPDNEESQKNDSTNELLEPLPECYVETIVTYREDFVPVTDRILDYLKSWTGGPGPET